MDALNESLEQQAIKVRTELIRLRDMFNDAISNLPSKEKEECRTQVSEITKMLYKTFGGQRPTSEINEYPFQYYGNIVDNILNN